MEDNSSSTGDYRFMILENKAAQIKKLAALRQFLILNAYSPESSGSNQKGD